MTIVDKKKLKNGTIVQIRQNGKSVGFTAHTDKSIDELKTMLIDFLSNG